MTQDLVYIGCRHVYDHTGFFLPADLAIWIQLLVAIGFGLLFYAKIERSLLRLI